jgi:formylglycine-generating enzyme required for sulfatase activity
VVTIPPQSLPNRAQETKPAIAEVSAPPPLVAPFDAAAARTGQQSWAAYLKTPVEIGNSIGMKFVLVPAGVFTMGSPPEELGHQGNENQVPVTLTQAFWLGQHVVTQAEWQLMMQTAPWKSRAQVKQGRDYPATNVSWNDARRFCEKLTQQERTAGSLPFGWQYTLPTEAQWEYACRAGTISRYSFGDDESKLSDYAWWGGPVGGNASAEQYAHAVGQKKPNRFGLSDMHGNVWEWCRDSYANGLPGGTNPLGLSQGSDRVNRAGSWYSSAALCRSASRKGFGPSERRRDLGFRVARVPVGTEPVGTEPVGTEPVGTEVVKIPPGEKRPAEAALSAPAVTPMPNVATTAPKISGRPFLVRGEWTIENDELVQPTLAAGHEHPLVVFGGPALSHYDLTLEAKETGGYEALGIFFHWLGPGHYRKFFLASNRELNFSYSYDGKWSRDDGSRKKLSYSANQWYSLKLEVRGDTFRAYLDGVLRFEQIDGRFTHGRICLFTSDTAARFRRIRVSDPQGKVLFEGLPELPSASNKSAP